MRVTSIFLAGVFALAANAQSNTPSPSASGTLDPATAAQTSQQAAIIKCLDACTPGDVSCTSKCISVPNPNEQAVDQTNKCVANCPKGKGTETDNLNYSNCLEGCIGKYYYSATGVPVPQVTGGNGASGSGTAGSGSGTTGGSGPSGTGSSNEQTSKTSSSTSTGTNAAEVIRISGPAVGLVGFLAAVLAL